MELEWESDFETGNEYADFHFTSELIKNELPLKNLRLVGSFLLQL